MLILLSLKYFVLFPSKSWAIDPSAVLTDKPSNTYVRAPGSTQGHAAVENVMEHLAHQLGMDPLEFRMINMVGEGKKSHPLQDIIKKLRDSSDYDKRKTDIETFNKVISVGSRAGTNVDLAFQENLWQKKGISLIPIRYGHTYWGTRYHVSISVYQGDGSVAVTHGGIEMGQGINTKVAQVVAKELGVDLDMVRVKPSNNFANVNGSVTGGGMGSECNCSVSLMAHNNVRFGAVSVTFRVVKLR